MLMHKNIPVADIVLDETGYIAKVAKIYDERHLPVGVRIYSTGIDRKALNDWWLGRSIPASRVGLQEALAALGLNSAAYLIEKCLGLSLSDQYWVSPKSSGLKWENINFFVNDFSKDVGEILFGRELGDSDELSLFSPDNTSDGYLQKKWVIIDERRYLMKGGEGAFLQQPFNEVIASEIMRKLGINHVSYTLTMEHEKPYSLCENFITPMTELVPAGRVISLIKRLNSDSDIAHLLRCCDALEISNPLAEIEKMITLDFIIANEDRHWNNI
jgi:hypothetical protein